MGGFMLGIYPVCVFKSHLMNFFAKPVACYRMMEALNPVNEAPWSIKLSKCRVPS